MRSWPEAEQGALGCTRHSFGVSIQKYPNVNNLTIIGFGATQSFGTLAPFHKKNTNQLGIIMIRSLFISAAIVLLSACSTTPYENFDPASVQGKSTMKVVSQVQQEEIIKEFTPSNAGGAAGAQFGLIGALVGAAVDASVNSSRAKGAEEMVEPFRNATLDINVRNLLEQSFEDNIERLDWVADKKLVSEQFESDTKIKSYLSSIDEELLLLINSHYSLKPNTEVIEFVANYSLYDKAAAMALTGKAKPKPVYQNSATLQSYPHNGSVRRLTEEERQAEIAELREKFPTDESLNKSMIKRNQKKLNKALSKLKKKTVKIPEHNRDGSIWLENDAALLREELAAAPALLAKLIVDDLSGEYPLPMAEEAEGKKNKEPQLLEELDNGMVITRQPNGALLYKHRNAPIYGLFGPVF